MILYWFINFCVIVLGFVVGEYLYDRYVSRKTPR